MTQEKQEEKKEETKMREIILKTDGNSILIEKAEVAGKFEFIKILEEVILKLRQ